MHTAPIATATALVAAALHAVGENHRLKDELDWHRDALHAAWSALDGASAVIACGRSFGSERPERPSGLS